jgi:hypothetical protein
VSKNRDLFKILYGEYKNSARKKSARWEMPFTLFKRLIQRPCFYCGAEPSPTSRSQGAFCSYTNGLDRKIPDEGYTPHNVVPCCSECNYMKSGRTKYDFLARVRAIYETTKNNSSSGT